MGGKYILDVILLVLENGGACSNTCCNFAGLNNRKLESCAPLQKQFVGTKCSEVPTSGATALELVQIGAKDKMNE